MPEDQDRPLAFAEFRADVVSALLDRHHTDPPADRRQQPGDLHSAAIDRVLVGCGRFEDDEPFDGIPKPNALGFAKCQQLFHNWVMRRYTAVLTIIAFVSLGFTVAARAQGRPKPVACLLYTSPSPRD